MNTSSIGSIPNLPNLSQLTSSKLIEQAESTLDSIYQSVQTTKKQLGAKSSLAKMEELEKTLEQARACFSQILRKARGMSCDDVMKSVQEILNLQKSVSTLNDKILDLDKQIQEDQNKLTALNLQILDTKNSINSTQEKIASSTALLQQIDSQISITQLKIDTNATLITKEGAELASNTNTLNSLQTQLSSVNSTIESVNSQIKQITDAQAAVDADSQALVNINAQLELDALTVQSAQISYNSTQNTISQLKGSIELTQQAVTSAQTTLFTDRDLLVEIIGDQSLVPADLLTSSDPEVIASTVRLLVQTSNTEMSTLIQQIQDKRLELNTLQGKLDSSKAELEDLKTVSDNAYSALSEAQLISVQHELEYNQLLQAKAIDEANLAILKATSDSFYTAYLALGDQVATDETQVQNTANEVQALKSGAYSLIDSESSSLIDQLDQVTVLKIAGEKVIAQSTLDNNQLLSHTAQLQLDDNQSLMGYFTTLQTALPIMDAARSQITINDQSLTTAQSTLVNLQETLTRLQAYQNALSIQTAAKNSLDIINTANQAIASDQQQIASAQNTLTINQTNLSNAQSKLTQDIESWKTEVYKKTEIPLQKSADTNTLPYFDTLQSVVNSNTQITNENFSTYYNAISLIRNTLTSWAYSYGATFPGDSTIVAPAQWLSSKTPPEVENLFVQFPYIVQALANKTAFFDAWNRALGSIQASIASYDTKAQQNISNTNDLVYAVNNDKQNVSSAQTIVNTTTPQLTNLIAVKTSDINTQNAIIQQQQTLYPNAQQDYNSASSLLTSILASFGGTLPTETELLSQINFQTQLISDLQTQTEAQKTLLRSTYESSVAPLVGFYSSPDYISKRLANETLGNPNLVDYIPTWIIPLLPLQSRPTGIQGDVPQVEMYSVPFSLTDVTDSLHALAEDTTAKITYRTLIEQQITQIDQPAFESANAAYLAIQEKVDHLPDPAQARIDLVVQNARIASLNAAIAKLQSYKTAISDGSEIEITDYPELSQLLEQIKLRALDLKTAEDMLASDRIELASSEASYREAQANYETQKTVVDTLNNEIALMNTTLQSEKAHISDLEQLYTQTLSAVQEKKDTIANEETTLSLVTLSLQDDTNRTNKINDILSKSADVLSHKTVLDQKISELAQEEEILADLNLELANTQVLLNQAISRQQEDLALKARYSENLIVDQSKLNALLQQTSLSNLQAQLQAAQLAKTQLGSEISRLETRNDFLRTDISRLRSEQTTLTSELTRLKALKVSLPDEIRTLKKKLKELQHSLEEMLEEQEEIQREIEKLQKRKERYIADLRTLTSNLDHEMVEVKKLSPCELKLLKDLFGVALPC